MAGETHVPPEEFAAGLRGLDAEGMASLVGGLWRATADEVTVDPPVVSVLTGDETTRLLVVPADGGSPDLADVDAVVLADPGNREWDLPVVGPNALRRRLLYALEREEADALCERYLGWPARAGSPASDREGDDELPPAAGSGAETSSDRSGGTSRGGGPVGFFGGVEGRPFVVGVCAVVVLAAAAAVIVVGGPGGALAGPDGGESPTSATGAASGDSIGSPPATATATPVSGETPEATPSSDRPRAGTTEANGTLEVTRYADLEPTCNRSYFHVVQIQMNALLYSDGARDDGVRTVRRFASPRNREAVSYEELVRVLESPAYDALLTYDSVEYSPERIDEDSARVEVVTRENGTETGEFTFRLSKQEGGEFDGCWMTDGVSSADAYPS